MQTGKYKHYKGNLYEMLGLAMHSETREKLVVYRALYDNPDLEEEFGLQPMFVRPYSMFNETIIIDGKEVKRFEYVGPMED